MMKDIMDISVLINENKEKMSKGQKKISQYVLNNYEKAAFMTAAALGNVVGVSESTVVRYATLLGFSGYPEFQKSLEKMIHNKLSTISRIEIENCDEKDDDIYKNVFSLDIKKIKQLSDTIDKAVLNEAVANIMNAENVYIIGLRNSSAIASFFGFNLNMIRKNVKIITSCNESEIFEQMIHISKNDLLIGISFPRYSMRTLKAMEFANDRTAKVMSITDNEHSPINLYSSCNLLAGTDMTSIMESLVAPMSLVNAVLVALSIKNKQKVIEMYDGIEEIYENYSVIGNDEMNMFDDMADIDI